MKGCTSICMVFGLGHRMIRRYRHARCDHSSSHGHCTSTLGPPSTTYREEAGSLRFRMGVAYQGSFHHPVFTAHTWSARPSSDMIHLNLRSSWYHQTHGLGIEDVSNLLILCQIACPNSCRLMKSPITRSCICSVLEKQIVRRTNRLIRVRKLMCLLSIFCVFSLPTLWFSASRYRS